jgi:hypothetical protein
MHRPTPVAGRESPRMGARTARLESGRAQLESSMRSLTRSRSPRERGHYAKQDAHSPGPDRPVAPPPPATAALDPTSAPRAHHRVAATVSDQPTLRLRERLRKLAPDQARMLLPVALSADARTPFPPVLVGRMLALSDHVAVASASCSGDRLPQALRAKLALHTVPPPSRRATRALLLAQSSTAPDGLPRAATLLRCQHLDAAGSGE